MFLEMAQVSPYIWATRLLQRYLQLPHKISIHEMGVQGYDYFTFMND